MEAAMVASRQLNFGFIVDRKTFYLPCTQRLSHAMKLFAIFVLFGFFVVTLSPAQQMRKAEEPTEVGMISIGESYFPQPDGVRTVAIDTGDFEGAYKNSDLLRVSGGSVVKSEDSPQGEAYYVTANDGMLIFSASLPASSWRPHLLSLWLKSEAPVSGRVSCETHAVYYGRHTPVELPSTGGKWKRVGVYFRTAPGTTEVGIQMRGGKAIAVAIDDVDFREATEDEFTKAWSGWRSRYPARDLSARPDDGKNLSLFLKKLMQPDPPRERALKVMGIGSSYTNMLGNGERLIQWVREKFPDAPPIVYKKHVGSAVNYDFTRGWMRQMVLAERPDLVILYSGGTAEDLEKLLRDFRAHSTADVIVASMHVRERAGELSDKTINDPTYDEIAKVAKKYGCEWVDSRREWGAYVREHGEGLSWLLRDAVHQSDHGALVINENIVRHIQPNESPGYAAETRERFVKYDGSATEVKFTGNRIDVIAKCSKDGGTLGFSIDGVAGAELAVFSTTLIRPAAGNHKPKRGSAADRSPHMVRLGAAESIVPQSWEIRMTSDVGDYMLIGSVTGEDGSGNNGSDFTSDSGQITVPTELWRRRLESDGTHSNKTGDVFTWKVKRAALGEIDFSGRAGTEVQRVLADQLTNGEHVLRLDAAHGNIIGFRIFQPMVFD